MRKRLRIISVIMLAAAAAFVICAISAPTLGHVIYIGSYKFGAEQKRICYAVYIISAAALFAASLFVKADKGE